ASRCLRSILPRLRRAVKSADRLRCGKICAHSVLGRAYEQTGPQSALVAEAEVHAVLFTSTLVRRPVDVAPRWHVPQHASPRLAATADRGNQQRCAESEIHRSPPRFMLKKWVEGSSPSEA